MEADIGIHKNILRSEIRPSDLAQWIRIVWDGETNDIMKTVKCLEESDLLRKFVSKTIKNKARRWIS